MSVHDNVIYAHSVDYEQGTIVLNTHYSENPGECTDVIFTGVVTHHFEQQSLGGLSPRAVLFDITEEDPENTLRSYAGLLGRTKNHGWPVLNYTSLANLVEQLTGGGARCFRVQGQCGIDGFVFAMNLRLEQRAARSSPQRPAG